MVSSKGQIIHDHLRFFKGDHPEILFEGGNSQGGTFPYLCGLNKGQFNDFRSSLVGIENRHQTLIAGPLGRRNVARPLENLSMEQVLDELRTHDPPGWQNYSKSEDLRKTTLKGINRLPALLFVT